MLGREDSEWRVAEWHPANLTQDQRGQETTQEDKTGQTNHFTSLNFHMSRTGAFFKGGSATHSSRNVRPCSERSHFPNVTSEDYVRTLFHNKLTSQI